MSHNKMLKLVAKHDEARKQQTSTVTERGPSSKRDREDESTSFTLVRESSSNDDSHSNGSSVNDTGKPHGGSSGGPTATSISAPLAASAGPPAQQPRLSKASPLSQSASPLSGGGLAPATPASIPHQVPMVFPFCDGWHKKINEMKVAALRATAQSLGLEPAGVADEIRAQLLQLQGEAVVEYVDKSTPVNILSLGAGFASPAAASAAFSKFSGWCPGLFFVSGGCQVCLQWVQRWCNCGTQFEAMFYSHADSPCSRG